MRFLSSTSFKCKQNPNLTLLSIRYISNVSKSFYVSVTKEFWYLHYLGFKILDVPWEKIEFYQTLFITCKDDLEVIRKEDSETFDRIKSSFKCIIF